MAITAERKEFLAKCERESLIANKDKFEYLLNNCDIEFKNYLNHLNKDYPNLPFVGYYEFKIDKIQAKKLYSILKNKDNRALSADYVNMYKRKMDSGLWKDHPGDTISINS